MENYTLNKIASDKANTAAKRADAIRVHIDKIVTVDGFNVRDEDDDLREHIASLLAAMVAGQPIPPVEVWVNPETGAIEMIEGHCRHRAYGQYRDISPDWDGYISAVQFVGTPFQRKMRIASSNKQLKLKPVELGRLFMHARDVLGATRKEIAAEAGVSVAHVDQMILLAGGSPEVQQAIDDGQISATEAVKLIRDHGDQAPVELERRKELAAEQGKGKVTAGVVKDKPAAAKKEAPPSRPKVDFVVSCAVVLATHIEQDETLLAKLAEVVADPAGRGMTIPVHADLINDLLEAVREMRGTHKDQREMPV